MAVTYVDQRSAGFGTGPWSANEGHFAGEAIGDTLLHCFTNYNSFYAPVYTTNDGTLTTLAEEISPGGGFAEVVVGVAHRDLGAATWSDTTDDENSTYSIGAYMLYRGVDNVHKVSAGVSGGTLQIPAYTVNDDNSMAVLIVSGGYSGSPPASIGSWNLRQSQDSNYMRIYDKAHATSGVQPAEDITGWTDSGDKTCYVVVLEAGSATPVAPDAPTGVSATAGVQTGTVDWTDETAGVPDPTYEVDYRENGSPWDNDFTDDPNGGAPSGWVKWGGVDLEVLSGYLQSSEDWYWARYYDGNKAATEDKVIIGIQMEFLAASTEMWLLAGAAEDFSAYEGAILVQGGNATPIVAGGSSGSAAAWGSPPINTPFKLFYVHDRSTGVIEFYVDKDDDSGAADGSITVIADDRDADERFGIHCGENDQMRVTHWYVADYSDGFPGGGDWTSFSTGIAKGVETELITGLTGGTEYLARVRATNASGDSAWVESNAFTPTSVTVPDPVTDLAANPGDEEVVLSWSAPADGGDAITDYEYRVDGGTWISTGSATPGHTVASLTNGVEYDFEVRAINNQGAANASNLVSATPVVPTVAYKIGRWDWTGSDSDIPGTSWAAMPTITWGESRNDDPGNLSISGPTITLPPAGVGNVWVLESMYQFRDTSNGRHGPGLRFAQQTGDGDDLTALAGGFNRNNAESDAFVSSWGILDENTSTATIEMQWRRGADAPTGGLIEWYVEAIQIPRDAIGLYLSTDTDSHGSDTPSQRTGWTTVKESNSALIGRSGEVFNLDDPGRRYLVLGNQFLDYGSGRTMRIFGLRQDGTVMPDCQSYIYLRQSTVGRQGGIYSTVIESDGDTEIDHFMYAGSSAANALAEGGAENPYDGTATEGHHACAIIALPSSTEAYRSFSTTLNGTGVGTDTPVDIPWNPAGNIALDDAVFARANDDAVTVNADTDVMLGFNMRGRTTATATARASLYSQVTLNGVEQPQLKDGAYLRNDQSTTGTYGVAVNIIGSISVLNGNTIGVSTRKLATSSGAGVPQWSEYGGWMIDLASLAGTPPAGESFDVEGAGQLSVSGSGTLSVKTATGTLQIYP